MSGVDVAKLAEALERLEARLGRIEARLDRIAATLAVVERSGGNMDAHISTVERMLHPFQNLLRLRAT